MFARKKDILIIILILILAVLMWGIFYITQNKKATIAVITYDGKVVKTVSLSKDTEFPLAEDETVKFKVENQSISFIGASCPDKICENTGYLSKAGQTAVCLPKKVVLKVQGNTSVDIIAN